MARKKSYQRGSVRERPKGSNVWTLRYREFDTAKRRWVTKRERLGEFKEKKAARQAADTIMARVNERNNSPAPVKFRRELTFKDFIEGRWKAYTVSAKHQPSTVDNHASLIKKHLSPFFGQMFLDSITPSDIGDFLQSKITMSLNTQQNLYGLLRLMFDIAAQYDLIDHSL